MFIYKNNSILLICLGKHTTSVRCKSKVYCPKAHNNRANTEQIPFSSPSLCLSTGNQAEELCKWNCKQCTPFMFTVFFNKIFVRSSHGQSKCCTIPWKRGKVKIKSKKEGPHCLLTGIRVVPLFFF